MLALAIGEAMAQGWVYAVAKRGKLFVPDTVLGWRPIANLRLARNNANGERWLVETDSAGWREGRAHDRVGRRTTTLVVLGDSYAFGEGVDVADRFDEILARRHPEWSVVNHGVMGFGTDQELLTLPWNLRTGDMVLLLTYQNDMIDVTRRSFAGRSKPYYELDSTRGQLLLHRPRIGWQERLRDRSYLAATILARREREPSDYSALDWRRGLAIYDSLVRREAALLRRRGVRLLVVHHGDSLLSHHSGLARPYAFLDSIPDLTALSADAALAGCGGARVFLRDGHWGRDGHRCVAELLDRLLTTRASLAEDANGAEVTAVIGEHRVDFVGAVVPEAIEQPRQIVLVHRNHRLEHRASLDDVHEHVDRREGATQRVHDAAEEAGAAGVRVVQRGHPPDLQSPEDRVRDREPGSRRNVLQDDERVHEIESEAAIVAAEKVVGVHELRIAHPSLLRDLSCPREHRLAEIDADRPFAERGDREGETPEPGAVVQRAPRPEVRGHVATDGVDGTCHVAFSGFEERADILGPDAVRAIARLVEHRPVRMCRRQLRPALLL